MLFYSTLLEVSMSKQVMETGQEIENNTLEKEF